MRTAIAVGGVVGAALLVLTVAAVGVVLGVGVGVPDFGGVSGVDGGYEETTLHSFDTTSPACPAAGPTPHSREGVYSRPTDDGRRLSVVDNVTVEGERTGLDASLSEIGPGRYQLSLSRTGSEAWNGTCERAPELQYNATMNVSEPNDYTLLVTLDGELRNVYWSESDAAGGSAGASSSASGGGGSATGSAGDGSAGDDSTSGDGASSDDGNASG